MSAADRIAEVVKTKRLAMKLTQDEAGRMAGVSKATWYKLESADEGNRAEQTYTRIGMLYGWPADWVERVEAGATVLELNEAGSDAGPADTESSGTLASLRRQVTNLENQVAEMKELLLRALAERDAR